MTISERLKAIADMIDGNSNIIDIGCDHGLLDIYLARKFNNITCIASDINQNALNTAIENIKKYNCQDKIQTIISDGLEEIDVTKNSIIIISGMGTKTIKHILNSPKSLIPKQIIIQSNNDLYELRYFMIRKGFIINEEKVIKEKGIYYVIISFINGLKKYSKTSLYIGPKIIENRKINKDYLKYLKNKELLKLKNIPKKYIGLRLKIFIRLKKIMGYIK